MYYERWQYHANPSLQVIVNLIVHFVLCDIVICSPGSIKGGGIKLVFDFCTSCVTKRTV